jgi:predicted amidohydrolase YtcJ
MEEAIRCFTLNGAYGCMREDNIRGSLKSGKLADIVVIYRSCFSPFFSLFLG